ncbi:MAG TPA: PilT/PilU family type 4a pilus ATPase [Gaiellaceae bacterium]|jgi:twitching motility protein PilT
MDLDRLLLRISELGASDLHLKLGQPPLIRHDGSIEPVEGYSALTDADLEGAVATLTQTAPERRELFGSSGELDIGYEVSGLRFRVNAFRQRGAISVVCRVIPREIPDFEKLHMPAGVRRLADEHRGLVLVTGATGSGKSTTLASMIDHINRTRRQHVITIEDPIEMLHPDRESIVNQREVGIDTVSFAQALRRALRQDPDVILIGELRDSETAETALQAAESGHLVFSTMHTLDAAETISRMIEFFPGVKQPMIRSILAGVLRGVVSQRLLPMVDGGRTAAVEVMVVNDRIAELIRESRADEIPTAIREGTFFDMQTLPQALLDLCLAGLVDRDTATNAAPNAHDFLLALNHAEKTRAVEEAAAAQNASAVVPPSPEPGHYGGGDPENGGPAYGGTDTPDPHPYAPLGSPS